MAGLDLSEDDSVPSLDLSDMLGPRGAPYADYFSRRMVHAHISAVTESLMTLAGWINDKIGVLRPGRLRTNLPPPILACGVIRNGPSTIYWARIPGPRGTGPIVIKFLTAPVFRAKRKRVGGKMVPGIGWSSAIQAFSARTPTYSPIPTVDVGRVYVPPPQKYAH